MIGVEALNIISRRDVTGCWIEKGGMTEASVISCGGIIVQIDGRWVVSDEEVETARRAKRVNLRVHEEMIAAECVYRDLLENDD